MTLLFNLIWIILLPITAPLIFVTWFLRDPKNIALYLCKNSMFKAYWETLKSGK